MSRRYVASGRVQGVGFRYFVQMAAQDCGIRGWVRNLSNGDVEIRAEGEQDRIDRFLKEVRRGPRISRVASVHASDQEAEHFESFEITF